MLLLTIRCPKVISDRLISLSVGGHRSEKSAQSTCTLSAYNFFTFDLQDFTLDKLHIHVSIKSQGVIESWGYVDWLALHSQAHITLPMMNLRKTVEDSKLDLCIIYLRSIYSAPNISSSTHILKAPDENMSLPKIIGHRGIGADYMNRKNDFRENTYKSLIHAYMSGADGVEFGTGLVRW